jgi:hypothetical protein
MRYCRYGQCKRPFWPEKSYFYYCSGDCRVADMGADYQGDDRRYQRNSDERYGCGF